MSSITLQQRLENLVKLGQEQLLCQGLKGLEKESLRITEHGQIAQTPHLPSLGSALTHPYITTDYSEALLEFITPPYSNSPEVLAFLEEIHRYVYNQLARDEFLLATSMPCGFQRDEDIPIAQYGESNIGKMKTIYRIGLAYRYGRAMQAIAGIHFNFSVNQDLWPHLHEIFQAPQSLANFRSHAYFALIRNVQRYGWLLLYLFGASPAVCRSFLECRGDIPAQFSQLTPSTFYAPYATSLRMSDIGYKNKTQSTLHISLNSLEEYVQSLCHAIETPHPPYEAIGVKVNGNYRQLNTNILQIENEYYSSVRPKQITRSGEKPTFALKRRGVRYVEIRALDLNPFEPLGINLPQLYFLELFLWYCLLEPSPTLSQQDFTLTQKNFLATAYRGRDPELTLNRGNQSITLKAWAIELINRMKPLAALMDQSSKNTLFQESLAAQREKVFDSEQTPSAQMLNEMRAHKDSFAEFALRKSKEHAEYFRSHPLPDEKMSWFKKNAQESLEVQRNIEASDKIGFEEFLQRYFTQTCGS